jgi:hypothetical protein
MLEDTNPPRNRQPRWRAARRRELKEHGITPTRRRYAWSVHTTALQKLPEWVHAVKIGALGTLASRNRVWLNPRDAKRLTWQDHLAGGQSEVTTAELRYCEVCGRPLIGIEAEKRRKLSESSSDGRQQPCGPECAQDIASGCWKKLGRIQYRRKAAAEPYRRPK